MHPLTEVVEVAKGAVLVAFGDDQLDQPFADVAHRRQPEADRQHLAGRGIDAAVGAEVAQRAIHVGTVTSIPMTRHSAR
jgi:hypothetical protein